MKKTSEIGKDEKKGKLGNEAKKKTGKKRVRKTGKLGKEEKRVRLGMKKQLRERKMKNR